MSIDTPQHVRTLSGVDARSGLVVSRVAARRHFDDRPLLVFWEMTKACDLSCFHCRASAQPEPDSDELSGGEGRALIDELASMGRPRPILILTGGDCLKRPDIIELVSYPPSAVYRWPWLLRSRPSSRTPPCTHCVSTASRRCR